MIELQGVAKSFGKQTVVQPLDLTCETGRTTILLGPSGCGKSTLIRMMAGLVRPDRGTVRLLGQRLSPASAPRLRLGLGYVIQEGGLFPHLSAFDNVALVARQQRWTESRVKARAAELAGLVRLDVAMLRRFPAQLSGGQRQRVGIMRALMLDPPILLFDEPMGALDPLVRHDLQEDLRHLFRSLGKTVVLVTHDLAEGAFLGDRLLLFNAGRVAQSGGIADLLDRPADAFVEKFLAATRPLRPEPAAASAERGSR